MWLHGVHIPEYTQGTWTNHEQRRTRKLLLHRKEIERLIGKTRESGLSLVPLSFYFKDGRVKVELALAKGKQHWDKRETERRRTADKEAREAVARGDLVPVGEEAQDPFHANAVFDTVEDGHPYVYVSLRGQSRKRCAEACQRRRHI